ncbi:tRNA (guanosine(37)-N1)-methyltransferase TrmD [Paremcibacter congregatus]|uniref:tRNA (guanine-N(1)-)-methyltransferase n=1 Tax=Paremcibacter congregatus TaxID=2043170 RepID=A0A2G4YP93_9PROT|nr:tRNA (guanosine(37)-N1)-methyltransferase TrmD [Paremcibacter congregatus]PHZ84120.1 tRNA (guanosine(37)-N1)-methyltransferase TrmD [Paremcibacter congregatus]QDE25821.1 tRNA (guanosine(37)-N1)-methyltransferase TrmD [Paremcibacter congregatus]
MMAQVSTPLWQAQILTLFPEMFPGPLGVSLAGKALEKGIWTMDVVQIRDYATDKHRNVDDTPAGGGPGMVMRADVLGAAIDDVVARRQTLDQDAPSGGGELADFPVVYLSPRGKRLDQALIREFAAKKGITLICGRFEGVDERVLEGRNVMEVSLGDFILSGGEVAAMALMDAVVRTLPGVIGQPETLDEESFESGLLEYPHYTRPKVWEGREIPDVLQSGHHGKIKDWRLEQSKKLTEERRPDLWEKYLRDQE